MIKFFLKFSRLKILFYCLFLIQIFIILVQISHKNSFQAGIEEDYKVIAFGTGDVERWKKFFSRLIYKECEENRCRISSDPNALETADAIVLNQNFRLNDSAFVNRNPNAFYVFLTTEASSRYGRLNTGNLFHWTMTYHVDSDIRMPFGRVFRRKKKRPPREINYVNEETLKLKKMAIYMSSRCNSSSKREDLVRDLKRFIPVDVYGRCGTKVCGSQQYMHELAYKQIDPCMNLLKDYAFFFSFENALCEDYITEKFFRVMGYGAIPVVYGASNYGLFAPPNSFIDAKEFKTSRGLADYLKKVASNVTLFNKYLKWQEDYDVDVGFPYSPLVCGLCKKLHEVQNRAKESLQKTMDVGQWLEDYKNERCYRNLQQLRNKFAKY